jgi:hypothetical protein
VKKSGIGVVRLERNKYECHDKSMRLVVKTDRNRVGQRNQRALIGMKKREQGKEKGCNRACKKSNIDSQPEQTLFHTEYFLSFRLL